MIKLPSLSYLISSASASAKRFPFVLLSGFLATAQAIYMIESEAKNETELLVVTVLGIPVFFAVRLFLESKQKVDWTHRAMGFVSGLAILGAFYWTLRQGGRDAYFLRICQTGLLAHLLVSFAAHFGRRGENGFWQLNKSLFLRFLASTLYAGVFFVGITIALVTVNALFSLKIEEETYLELWFISALILQTWYFISGIPKDILSLEKETSYPRGLRFFVQYLLIPLVSLYMVILYAYMAKIFFTWDWPRGYIGWLVSVMSVLGIFNLLLIDPEKKRQESRWIATYSKYYYLLILPLLAMLYIAIGKRISDYGITEKRYFLFALGSLLLGLAIYFIFSKKKDIRWIPISLFLLTVVSLWGPISAYNVSRRSQVARADQLLVDNGLLKNGKATKATKEVSEKAQRELSSIFDYLTRTHGLDTLSRWFDEGLLERATYTSSRRFVLRDRKRVRVSIIMQSMDLEYIDRWKSVRPAFYNLESNITQVPLDISKYRSIYLFEGYGYETVKIGDQEFQMGFDKDKAKFYVKWQGETLEPFDFSEVIKLVENSPTDQHSDVAAELMTVTGQVGEMNLTFVIRRIQLKSFEGKTTPQWITGLLLFP